MISLTFCFWDKVPGIYDHCKAESSVKEVSAVAVSAKSREHYRRALGHDKVEEPLGRCGHPHV